MSSVPSSWICVQLCSLIQYVRQRIGVFFFFFHSWDEKLWDEKNKVFIIFSQRFMCNLPLWLSGAWKTEASNLSHGFSARVERSTTPPSAQTSQHVMSNPDCNGTILEDTVSVCPYWKPPESSMYVDTYVLRRTVVLIQYLHLMKTENKSQIPFKLPVSVFTTHPDCD